MARAHRSAAIEPFVEALLAETDPSEHDRILLDCAFALGVAGAAAIWKRVGGRDRRRDGPRRWRAILARGPADALPPDAQVVAWLEGTLACELPGRRVVLRAAGAEDRLALALGDVERRDDRLDLLEGVLLVWASLRADADTVEALAPLRPLASSAGARSGPTSAATILRTACQRARARGIDIELEIDAALEAEPSALAASELGNALAHLVTRAGSPRVRVAWRPCRTDAGGTLLSVEDSSRRAAAGPGTPFGQDRGGFDRELQRRVERAGGSLLATTSSGRGAKFLLHLPRAS